MKSKIFILIMAGFFLSGRSVLIADTPGITDSTGIAIHTENSGLTLSYNSQFQPSLSVNENEVKAGLLYDAVSGKIIWQKNNATAFPIASLTKMMVALLAVEDVRAGKISWNDHIKWTREIIVGSRKKRRKIYSDAIYTLRDVFKASMIASNNECAEQMARFLGNGDLRSSIDRMNTRAKELGMMNTFFSNPTGLPAPHVIFDNSSSPSDLLLLTLEMLKYNEVVEIASLGYAAIENGKSTSVISNHNHLTIDYSGEVDGLKTGYTRRAGFCLVATAAKCEHRLISIVLGCRGPQIRNDVVRDMFNDYYSSIGLDKLGPNCASPLSPSKENGNYITIYERVRKSHVVKKGESLSAIASRYKCSTTQLKGWNRRIINSNRVQNGQRLTVIVNQPKSVYIKNPVNGNEADDDKPLITDSEKQDLEKATETAENNSFSTDKIVKNTSIKYFYHTVEPGDTLFNIASRYKGSSVEELKSLNKIYDLRNLKPGTRIKVKVQA